MILAARKVVEKKDSTISLEGTMVIKELSEVFQKDLPNKLPPTRNIQHTINLVSGLSLPNLSHYRMNPTEHVKLKRQVVELARVSLGKAWAFVRSSHCWRQRKMDIGAYALIINKITIKYHFSMSILDDMLDMMSSATIFSEIDMKSGYHQIHICPKDE